MADHIDYLPGELPAIHSPTHADGGVDEINLAGMSGELANDQPPKAHDLGGAKHNADTLANLNAKIIATTLDDSGDPRDPNAHKLSHQNGGADEISVAGLSGELADDQPPKAHDLGGAKHNADTLANLNAKIIATTLDDSGDPRDPNAHKLSHQNGGADEISVAGLSGELADDQPPKAHDLGGAKHNDDTLANLNLKVNDATLDDSGDPRDPNAHKPSHQNGGADEISVAGLAGVSTELAAHILLPTVHQDAPDLILTHKNIATAHQNTPQLILDHKGDASAHHTYAEGGWTMGLTFSGAAVGITYALHAGAYSRLGNTIIVTGYMSLTSKGTSVGDAVITGLPFTILNATVAYAAVSLRLTGVTYANQFQGYGVAGNTIIALEEVTELGVSSFMTDANFANNSTLMVNFIYRIA